jgi:ketosteroid isomerase-like protein
MSQENVDLARLGYEALAGGDVERVLELIDPDVSVEVHTGRPDLPETLHGHAGFLENLRGLMDVFEDIEIEPEEFIDLGEHLVVPIYTAGHGRASGIKVENRVVHIWTIRDGKATRFRVFGTRREALEALGLTEQDLSAPEGESPGRGSPPARTAVDPPGSAHRHKST